ncbi:MULTISPECIES: hypothetical protein [unclassified Streptomyces]|uniref:hypothetical protein n=1 Tax=unclassified Streptomyces TaxID=2593676 RepID=UPI00365FEAB1
MIVITDDALTVADATRVDGTRGRGLADGDELVAGARRPHPSRSPPASSPPSPPTGAGRAAAARPCD